MSNFSETLKELIQEKNLDNKTFAAEVGISASCITDYMLKNALPTIDNLVKIADYFNCSTDYLLGLEADNQNLKFKKCPPFREQLLFLLNYYSKRPCDVINSEKAKIPQSSFFDWKRGKRQPTLDNVIELAKCFDCRIDFVLGRES